MQGGLTELTIPVFVRALLVVVLNTMSAIVLDRCSSGDITTIKIIGRLVVFTFLVFRIVGVKASMLYSRCLKTEVRGGVIRIIKMSLVLGLIFNLFIDTVLRCKTASLLSVVKLHPRLVRCKIDCVGVMKTFTFFRTVSLAVSTSLHDTGGTICPVVMAMIIGVLGVVNGCSLVFNGFNVPTLKIRNTTVSATFTQKMSVIVLFMVLFHGRVPEFPLSCFYPFPFIRLGGLLGVKIPSTKRGVSCDFSRMMLACFVGVLKGRTLTAHACIIGVIVFICLFTVTVTRNKTVYVKRLMNREGVRTTCLLNGCIVHVSVLISLILSYV